jgi:hypothetical protein
LQALCPDIDVDEVFDLAAVEPEDEGGGGGDSSGILMAHLRVAHSTIQAIVGNSNDQNSPVVIAAPGVGKVIMPVACFLMSKIVAPYTNIHASQAAIRLTYGQFDEDFATWLQNGVVGWNETSVTDFLTKNCSVTFHPLSEPTEGPLIKSYSLPMERQYTENKPIKLHATNAGLLSPEFDGGHASNYIDITVLYYVVDLN